MTKHLLYTIHLRPDHSYVYLITDFVTVISDNDVGFLDPHEAQFKDHKDQLTFNYTWELPQNHGQASDFADQWAPLIHDIFNLTWDHFFKGLR